MRVITLKIPRVILTHTWSTIVKLLCLLAIAFGGTNSVNATTKQPVAFVGSAQCVQCHEEVYAAWQQSDHHKAMQPASKATVLGDFNDVRVSFHGIETRLFESDGEFRVATLGKQGKPGVYLVKYTFGHYPLQQYLLDSGKGQLQALNLAWDSRSVASTPPGQSMDYQMRCREWFIMSAQTPFRCLHARWPAISAKTGHYCPALNC